MADKLKILISEKNSRIVDSYTACYADKPVQLYFCIADGRILLENIEKYKPDVVICDVFMRGLDAIAVKEIADSYSTPPSVFMIASAYENDDIIKRVLNAGFNYYFIKPFDINAVYNRIISAIGNPTENNLPATLDIQISKHLQKLEMPSHLNGCNYLKYAIKLVAEHPYYINSMTRKLYPKTAEKFDTTASRVERSIRTAIETAWERAETDIKETYFPYYAANYTKPSNSEFIAHIADIVRNSFTTEISC